MAHQVIITCAASIFLVFRSAASRVSGLLQPSKHGAFAQVGVVMEQGGGTGAGCWGATLVSFEYRWQRVRSLDSPIVCAAACGRRRAWSRGGMERGEGRGSKARQSLPREQLSADSHFLRINVLSGVSQKDDRKVRCGGGFARGRAGATGHFFLHPFRQ